jgi:hypothetical protein
MESSVFAPPAAVKKNPELIPTHPDYLPRARILLAIRLLSSRSN